MKSSNMRPIIASTILTLLVLLPDLSRAASPNVALGRPTSQSSTLSTYASDLAVNGNTGDFTHTQAGLNTPSTWEVNLTNLYAIERIILYNRSSCCGSRLRDITVRITDVTGTVTNWTSALLNPENTGNAYPNGPATITVDLVALTGAAVNGGRVRVTRTPDPDLSGTGGQGNADEADVLAMGEVEVQALPAQLQIVPLNSTWRYLATGVDPGATWTATNFNDAAWSTNNAELGYGDGDETAVIGYGPDPNNKYITTWFRRSFVVTNATYWSNLLLRTVYDDGAVVHLNGTEVRRINMPAGPITASTLALSDGEFTNELAVISPAALVNGTNVIAVEIHQGSTNSADLSFALELTGIIPPLVAITTPSNGQVLQAPATIPVTATASDADGSVVSVQLFQGTNSLGSAGGSSFTATVGPLLEGAYSFSAVARDSAGYSSTSAPVNITVTDTNPPALVSVFATTNSLAVTFTKQVVPPGATNGANYAISGGISVLGAAYGAGSNTVILTTTPMSTGTNYLLTVNNVTDSGARVIATNSSILFNLLNFSATDIGSPALPGSSSLVGDGAFDVTGGGADIGGASDQFQFESRSHTGDFDVKVRVNSLTFADLWSKAGLMARETLAANSRFVASLATPTMAGCFLSYRDSGSATLGSGSFPASYPDTWLRLKRAGNVFSGFAGPDGATWAPLGSVTIAMSSTVYLGFSVGGHSTNATATAQFRDFAELTNNPVATTISLPREPLGPSSRRTALVISEIHYHPRNIPGVTNSLEFVELFNSGSINENLGGWRLSGSIDYTFPTNTILRAGGFLVVAREPASLAAHHGISGVLGPFTNSLPNDNGTVRLRNRQDAVMLEVNYRGANPWPIAADGAGHSLTLVRPSYGEGNVAAWSASDTLDGSPGRAEPWSWEPLRNVVINEFLANPAPPATGFIELYNHANSPADVSGAWLSDDPDTNKFRIPDGTVIPARGFVAFTEAQLGFGLAAGGERIFLWNSNATRVVDTVDYDAQAAGRSSGRVPDGGVDWYPLSATTSGTNNAAPWRGEIVINELMYNPISGNSDEEFIELFNRGTNTVSLAGWKLSDGVSFEFPTNTTLNAGAYLVVAKNATNLMARYGGALSIANTLGNYSGTLANGGERVALTMPQTLVTTNTNTLVVTTNVIHPVACEVTYGTAGRWGNWSDGGGSSLELLDPNADPRAAANWADSDETAKAPWTNVEYTWGLGEPLGSPTNDNLHIMLLGIGECLVDEVEVRSTPTTTVNLIGANSGFESGTNGWTFQGSHDQSVLENSGYLGTKSLRLRAASRGDNGANKVRSPAFSALAANTTTLRCKARWLRGWPEILLRLHGGTLEAPGRLAVPSNLGTPGARNSRYATNAGPVITAVQHAPVLPAAGDPVVVTARVSDPDGVSAVTLRYRIDPAPGFNSVAMADNGTGGDAVAGDGVFSATMPAQAVGVMAAFYVQATDGLGATTLFPRDVFPTEAPRCFPNDAPSRECLVRWGETQMPGSFGTYHLWLSSTASNRWHVRDSLNNAAVDMTFVYNSHRVVYNAGGLYSGSAFHRGSMTAGPAGAIRCDYIVQMPKDDKVLGSADYNIVLPGNINGTTTTHDLSAQAEQTSYLFFQGLDLPHYFRRYVHVFVNGSQRNTISTFAGNFIYEDAQQPNGEVVDQWFPDDNEGELIKVEDWMEFNDAATAFSNNDGDLTRREVTLGGTNMLNWAPYRFMWRKRGLGAGDSANNYTNFLALLNAISPTVNSAAAIDLARFGAIADFEQWMREFACQHTVGNFDSYGYSRGKNTYTYKPNRDRVVMLPWDIDWTMGTGSGHGPTTDLFSGTSDARMVVAYNTPEIRRAYFRAFKELVDGPLNNAYTDPIMDAKAAAFTANNVQYGTGTGGGIVTVKDYVTARRNYILGQLAGMTNGFNVTTPASSSSATNVASITGWAPVNVKDISINGVVASVTWTSITNWTARVVLGSGTNTLVIQGLDRLGRTVAGTAFTNAVNYTGPASDPATSVVINEIMFRPSMAGGEYIELFNTSSNTTFDLAGWSLNGLDYTFPASTLLAPRSYLVLASDRVAFATLYGAAVSVFDQFNGSFQSDGETITLTRPEGTNARAIVCRVRYEPGSPWPQGANGTGASYQLVDSRQAIVRAGNWSAYSVPALYSPEVIIPASTNIGWRFASITTNVSGVARLLIQLDGSGTNWIDDISLVGGTNAGVGYNYIFNGGFEQAFSDTNGTPYGTNPWVPGTNMPYTAIVNDLVHSGSGALMLAQTNTGSAIPRMFTQFLYTNTLPTGSTGTLSFWYWSTNVSGYTNINVRMQSANLNITRNVFPVITPSNYIPPQLISQATNYISPGAASQSATNLPVFQNLWINELQAVNLTGPADAFGERESWIELHNPGTNAVSLDGLYLTTTYTNLTNWAFPSGHSIPAGGFRVVFLDNEPGQTTNSEIHAALQLEAGSGTVAIARVFNGAPQTLDYVTYTGLHADRSYGSFPDGQPFDRMEFSYVTAGGTNDSRSAPLVVFINEWMAGNTNALADPADGAFDDWFEIYNPGTNAVDLEAYYLTDTLTNKFKYRITTNGPHIIPPGGHLLVWADNETGQNMAGGLPRPDMHVNFQLAATGEVIALFAADGTQIDAVSFGQQTNDVSQGRYPDGNANIAFMPGTATPRAANSIGAAPNTPPVLDPVGNRTVYLGHTLSFTASASDAETPPWLLGYTLEPGAPVGAGITLGGAFTWTPIAAGNFAVTIRVTDNGAPAQSDTESINIEVLDRPAFTGFTRNGGNLELAWDSRPGRSYRVEYKDDLTAPAWTFLQDVTAAGNTLSFTNGTAAPAQRFFRVTVLP